MGALGKRSPDALRLARVVSLATRIEPELLRRARLKLLPQVGAGAEADLWFSPIVQSTTPLALTLVPAIADRLRRELAQSRESLRRAWEVVAEVHENAPAAIKLEERVIWRILAGGPDASDAVEKELMSVVSAIVTQNRTGLARWALRAVPRLPEEARHTKAAQTLLLTAAAHLGAWHLLGKQVENNNLSAAFINNLKVVLPRNLPQVDVGVRLLDESGESGSTTGPRSYVVEFSSPALNDKSDLIRVPGTVPLLLEISWSEDAGSQIRHLSLYQGRVETVKVGASTVTIRTAAGDIYTLSEDSGKVGGADLDTSAAAIARIPSRPAIGYVRRHLSSGDDIVETMTTSLAPGVTRVVQICGPAGAGKTTVAARVAHDLFDAFKQRVVWLSAEGRSDFNLNTVLDGISTQLGRSDLRTLNVKTKPQEVKSLLSLHPVIIFLDDFEIIQPKQQERCFKFLKSADCATVIISRQRIAKSNGAYLLLDQMTAREAQEFLERTIKSSRNAVIPEEFGFSQLTEACENNPLAIQLLFAQIAFTKNYIQALAEVSQRDGDPLTRVFDRSFNLPELGDDGRSALLALAFFVPSGSSAALAEVAGFGQDVDRLNEASRRITELKLTSEVTDGKRIAPDNFVPAFLQRMTSEITDGPRFAVDGFIRASVQRFLPKADEAVFKRRFVEYFLKYAEQHLEATAVDYDALEAEVENLLDAVDMALELKSWNEVVRICVALSRFLDVRGYWDEALRRNAQAQKAARTAKQTDVLPRLSETAGEIYLRRGELDKAEVSFRSVLRIYAKQPLNVDVANATKRLGSIALERESLNEAKRLYSESLAISRQLQLDTGVADNLHNLAIVAQLQGNLNEALRLYEESLRISERLGDQRSIAISQHQLGVVAREQGRHVEARSFFEQSLSTKRRLGDRNGMADTLHQLGLLLRTLGETQQAERVLNEALSIYDQLGSPAASEVARDLAVATTPEEVTKQQRSRPRTTATRKKRTTKAKGRLKPVARRRRTMKAAKKPAAKRKSAGTGDSRSPELSVGFNRLFRSRIRRGARRLRGGHGPMSRKSYK